MGELAFYFGTMGAGKSERLIIQASGYQLAGRNVLLLTAQPDCTHIESRNGQKIEAYSFGDFCEIDLRSFDSVFVDEAQFLTQKQVRTIAAICSYSKTEVFCYGLRTDFQGKLFEGSAALLSEADVVMPLISQCEHEGCRARATHNLRVDSLGNAVRTGEQVALRGETSRYRALCRKHWLEGK